MQRAPSVAAGDLTVRDLNKNGRLDPYEDPRRPLEERVEDLLGQMTLAEKAGLMFHTVAEVGQDGSLSAELRYSQATISAMVAESLISHFNVHALPAPRLAAGWYNQVQALAESTRLGIPVTISTDPRHAFSDNPATGLSSGGFSLWPEPIGLAAIGDVALVERFGEIAGAEYRALGIRLALHPMADLATEPRWARINGTFGEDAELAARLTAAYIRGFQGGQLGPASVACMTKHFPGGGPQKDGEDPHFPYGKEQVYPGGNFDYHLRPFEAAFEAGTAQIMPYYGQPIGLDLPEVAFAFNKDVITGLLRGRYGFDGVVCTDWQLIKDLDIPGFGTIEARAWGVERLGPDERAAMALEAGVDQFGGEACPEVIVGLVQSGRISEERIDQSVRRILRDKFRLGLFDDPYVDAEAAERIVGNAEFVAAGEQAQRRSIVLLKNAELAGRPALPVSGRPRLYVENINPEVAAQYGEVVAAPEAADLAILRLKTPYEPRNTLPIENFFHAGDLVFPDAEQARIAAVLAAAPTIVDIYLDRPAVIPEIAAGCAGLLGSFGASDAAVLDIVFGRVAPTGRLPFELPSSMEAVRDQKPDLPYDSADPLFPFGHGLGYE
ncbi:MAG TPA: glycoside hydrolase family 3 N-terminal domain-containing protein [Herpetosiphonaceae bacterium]|nr:glycoside hydrolase family 3 N-terminal domain-containing protein [Herpetosiphonaceae bacterium]